MHRDASVAQRLERNIGSIKTEGFQPSDKMSEYVEVPGSNPGRGLLQ